jgi:hypothetical protein
MGDTGITGQPRAIDLRCQLGDASNAARALEALLMNCYAAGVVAAILESTQALQQNGNNVALGDGTDDTAHT